MKKATLLIFYCLLFRVCSSSAQVTGIPFAPNGTRWSSEGYFYTGITSDHQWYSNYMIKGDTIIGNKYCQKLYGSSTQNFDSNCTSYLNYIYYFNRQLYTDTNLLYDFNLNVDDTLKLYMNSGPCMSENGYYPIPVDTVDSLYYGNKWRKRIVFQDTYHTNHFGAIVWVEGIGDYKLGMTSEAYNFYGEVAGNNCLAGGWASDCFQEPGYNSIGSCNYTSCASAINKSYETNKIFLTISPNPFNNEAVINANYKLQNASLSIYNCLGMKVKFINNIMEQSIILTRDNLPAGIYLLKLTDNNKILSIEKIVIVD
jgi:hypothetical protein